MESKGSAMRSLFLLALIGSLALGISFDKNAEVLREDTVRISVPVEEVELPDLSGRLNDFRAEKVTKDKFLKRRLPKPADSKNE